MARRFGVPGAVELEGLDESIRGLRDIDRRLPQAITRANREVTAPVQAKAQDRLAGRPGGGTYPRRRGMIGRKATQREAAIKLAAGRYPWALGAEFGAHTAMVFGRRMRASRLSRPHFPAFGGNQFSPSGGSGYIVQPTIREELPTIERTYMETVEREIAAAIGGRA